MKFFLFAKLKRKNIGNNIGKNLSGKYSQKFGDHAKQSATDVFKTVSPEHRPKIIDELRLKQFNNRISKTHKSFKNIIKK